MSSGTPWTPGAAGGLVAGGMVDSLLRGHNSDALRAVGNAANLGMSPRQRRLNRLWARYKCAHYDAHVTDWDGRERVEEGDLESVVTSSYVPPGFVDRGKAPVPLKYRRPSAPYHLAKTIVDRFTGLLFSAKRHPKIVVEGDADTEDFAEALVEATRLWPKMIQARTYGGATGTVAVGFKFVDGKPEIEVFDPRWVLPTFADRHSHKLTGIEIRYQYPVEEYDAEKEAWLTVWYWYRRVINDQVDVVFHGAPVGEGDEPDWQPEEITEHGLGFCPVVWIQNLPNQDDQDGDPDTQGATDLIDRIDMLLSQADRGVVANCDPTLSVVTDVEMPPTLDKGSGQVVTLPGGSSMSYLELSGTGATAAVAMAEKFRAYALEVAQCVLDHPEGTVQTATEVERRYSSMLNKADVMREQYGHHGVLPLIEMMLAAARKFTEARAVGDQIMRESISLPHKIVDGVPTVRKLGLGRAQVRIEWPAYFEPTIADAQATTTMATQAKAAGLVDTETAAKAVARFFGVRDVSALIERIAEERSLEQAELDAMALGALPPEEREEVEEEADLVEPRASQGASLPGGGGSQIMTARLELTATDLASITLVREGRASVGLGPLLLPDGSESPDNNLTIAEFNSKRKAEAVATEAATKAVATGELEA